MHRNLGAERAVFLLRIIFVFDLGEVETDLVHWNDVPRAAARLEGRNQQVRELDLEILLLLLAGLATGQQPFLDMLAAGTGEFDRIGSMKGKKLASSAVAMKAISREEAGRILKDTTPKQRADRRKEARKRKGSMVLRDAWLSPLTLNERGTPGPASSKTGLRASDKGFLSMTSEDYIALLDWTGREGKPSKHGKVPSELAPILQRLGIEGSMWSELVWNYKRYFGKSSSAGRSDRMKQHASAHSKAFSPGQKMVEKCFAQNG